MKLQITNKVAYELVQLIGTDVCKRSEHWYGPLSCSNSKMNGHGLMAHRTKPWNNKGTMQYMGLLK